MPGLFWIVRGRILLGGGAVKPIIIVGSGIAGLSCAIALAERGQKSVLVSTMPAERAQSVMAEGGINAALNTYDEQDTPQQHFADTMRAGCDLADPNAVRALVEGAPALVQRLSALGVAFNRTDTGCIDQRYFGGQKKRRTAFAQSSTGKQIVSALVQEARKWESKGKIVRLDHHVLRDIVKDEKNHCAGCIICDNHTKRNQFLPGAVLLASGGMNTLFGKTTGSVQNTAAAAAIAWMAGADCANLEMIQYHPTTTPISGKRALISEAARGEGGRLFIWRGDKKWYYMEEKYPELKNLMPRDIVARETEQVCREWKQESAFLDMTDLPPSVFAEKLSGLREFCMEFLHLDPQNVYIPVYPGIHYFMGGLFVDAQHRTTVPGLYAAGECACQYHGANRLGGNSLLGAAFGGSRAAETIAADAMESFVSEEVALAEYEEKLARLAQQRGQFCAVAVERELAACMNSCLGIQRCETDLQTGLETLHTLQKAVDTGRDASLSAADQLALCYRITLASAIVESAAARKESRGAHFRTDFPARNDAAYQKTTVAHWQGNTVTISFAEIPKEGAPWHIG